MIHSNRAGRLVPALLVAAAGLAGAWSLGGGVGVAAADEPILPSLSSVDVPLTIDSGPVAGAGNADAFSVVYETSVTVPGGEWLRLTFGDCTLAGDPGADGAYIRITSTLDGSQQVLNAESLRWWANTSAYFNGDQVMVEVLSRGGAGECRVAISAVTAGQPPAYGARTICGPTDDRALSTVGGNARLLTVGCTAWIIDDANHQFITAGHCTISATSVIEFNVPLSTASGGLQHPPAQDQFPVELTSNQGVSGGVGADWRYFGTLPNSNTGITSYQHENAFYTLAPAAPAVSGQSILIVGYGTVAAPVSSTWNQVQKTHTGPFVSHVGTTIRYGTDTTGGNSGSPVVDVSTGRAIGIHTHAGCTSTGGSNQGTAIEFPALQSALVAPLGVCASGRAAASGSILVAGDLNNNIGVVNTLTGTFGKTGLVPRTFQGMASDYYSGYSYAVDSTRRLWTIGSDGAMTDLGVISGTTLTITGLGFDPATLSLYGIAGATGQLLRIDTGTRVATTIGAPVAGSNISGLEFDATRGLLFGVNDITGGTRLVSISATTGAHTLVGALGTGTDCNGLAFDPATSLLYTIDAPTRRLLSISPTTGVATAVGTTGAMFGAAFGMTAVPLPACTADFDHDGDAGTDADIEAFFACLTGSCCATCPSTADFNRDGDPGADSDIESFFRVLAGGAC